MEGRGARGTNRRRGVLHKVRPRNESGGRAGGGADDYRDRPSSQHAVRVRSGSYCSSHRCGASLIRAGDSVVRESQINLEGELLWLQEKEWIRIAVSIFWLR